MDRTTTRIISEDVLKIENIHIKIFTQTADFRRAMFQFSNVVFLFVYEFIVV